MTARAVLLVRPAAHVTEPPAESRPLWSRRNRCWQVCGLPEMDGTESDLVAAMQAYVPTLQAGLGTTAPTTVEDGPRPNAPRRSGPDSPGSLAGSSPSAVAGGEHPRSGNTVVSAWSSIVLIAARRRCSPGRAAGRPPGLERAEPTGLVHVP